jgi:hypothetical protein
MALLSKKEFRIRNGCCSCNRRCFIQNHAFELGPLTGTLMLSIGLLTEALIFALSAFEPVDTELDWSLVYPEL